MPDRYFIKDGYRATEQVFTVETDGAGSYWTQKRIQAAAVFQYYVYLKCRDLVRERGFLSVLDVGCGPPVKVQHLLVPECSDITLVDQPTVEALAKRIAPACTFAAADLAQPEIDLGRHFDLVLCSDVVEHLLDPDPCMDFLRDQVADGGLAVLSTPERDHLRGVDCDYSPMREHIREWNQEEFGSYVESRGFQVLEQLRVPQRRLAGPVYRFARWRGLRGRRWSSCQIAVCRPH